MDQETKYEKKLEEMGFEVESESEPDWCQVWISNENQSYAINFWNGDAHVSICGTNITKRFAWYESALHFIIKHHLGL